MSEQGEPIWYDAQPKEGQELPENYPWWYISQDDPTRDHLGNPIPLNGDKIRHAHHENGAWLYEGPGTDEYVMQGRGQCWHDNGNIRLVGTWDRSQWNGFWFYWHYNGQPCYEGQFENGQFHGQGKQFHTCPDGKIRVDYAGEFTHGSWHGYGKRYRDNGTLWHEGYVDNGQWHGQGKLFYDNGLVEYEGGFHMGDWHGYGKKYRSDGTLEYEGGYDMGNWKGQGAQYEADGTTISWQGEFN